MLYACPDDPETTQYGAVYVRDSVFDKYRQQFFDPSGAPRRHTIVLRDSLTILAIDTSDDDLRALLFEGADVLQRRTELYGDNARPHSWDALLAWRLFRRRFSATIIG